MVTLRGATVALWLTLAALLVAFALLPYPAGAQGVTTQCIVNVAAQGTPDAITSAQLPCGTTTNLVLLTAAGVNETTTPTYAPTGSPPLRITRADGTALSVGDIAGAGFVALLSSTGTSWVLLNPAQAAQAALNTLAHVANLPALKTYPAVTTVLRDGYYVAGDGGGALYTYSTPPCSVGDGLGDNGYQVSSIYGGCWIASAPGGELDIRVWGAVSGGTATDNGPIINSAIQNFPGCPIIPATASGFYVATTVNVTNCLNGKAFQPTNQTPNLVFYGTSFLTCSRAVNPCVQVSVATGPNITQGPQMENMEIVGTSGAPNSGAVGLQFAGGAGDNTRNLLVVNFDTCVKWGPNSAPGNGGIASTHYNLSVAMCQTHHFVVDGWPEVKAIGGRAGFNGAGDYAGASDYIYFTKSLNQGSGGGANTITFDDYQFNSSGGVACAVRWGGWTGTGGIMAEYRLTNDHFEYHSYTGAASEGVFCSDATVTRIAQLFVTNMVQASGGLTLDAFNFGANTFLGQAFFTNNSWGCSSTTYAPSAADNTGDGLVYFSHNVFCGNVSLTANTYISAFLDHNAMNNLSVAGSWQFLSEDSDEYAALTDTATGHVAWSNPNPNAWTPVVTFGAGTPTYTSSGYWVRTSNGGLKYTFALNITNLNGATGTMTVTGLPKSCAGDGGAQPLQNVSGLVGLSGAVSTTVVGTTINFYQAANTGGASVLSATNFSPTTVMNGMAECVTAN